MGWDVPTGEDSLSDMTYTLTLTNRYTCSIDWFYLHWRMAWVVFAMGVMCFVTRLIPQLQWTHAWWGRLYIFFMLILTVTSLVIHNVGLPPFVLLLFVLNYVGIVGGWVAISFHQMKLRNESLKLAGDRIKQEAAPPSVEEAINTAAMDIVRGKTWRERFLSYKSFHGFMMFSSWYTVTGRIFVTFPDDEFTCFTQPGYKPIGDYKSTNWTTISLVDPEYDKLPWAGFETGWKVLWFILPLACAIVFGVVYSRWAADKESAPISSQQSVDEGNEDSKATQLAAMSTGG